MTTRVASAEAYIRGLSPEASPAGSGNENEGLTANNRMCIKNANLSHKKGGSLASATTNWKLYENPYYAGKSVAKSDGVAPQPAKARGFERTSLERIPCKQIGRESLVQKSPGRRAVRITPPPVIPIPSRSNASRTSPLNVSEPLKSKLTRPSKEPQQSINGDCAKLHQEAGRGSFHAAVNSHEALKVVTPSTNCNIQPIHNDSLIASLRSDLQASLVHLNNLEQSRLNSQAEIDNLTKQFDAKRELWHCRIQSKVAVSVQALKGEAKEERNSSKHLQSIHYNLEKDIFEVKKSLAKVKYDLEKEKEARRLLKDVGDELGKEIENDKALLKVAKRQAAKARYEAEQERKMLQMGEIWKEERVHTKLAQARYEVEEKAMVMDELKYQLETFLRTRRAAKTRYSAGKKQEPVPEEKLQHKLKQSPQASSLSSCHGTPSNKVLYSGSSKIEVGFQTVKQRRWNR